MQISMAWLQSLLPFELRADWVCERLTDAGIEVGSVVPAAPSFHGVVVARILAAEPVSESSHLVRCRLQVGQETCSVVTGASNARSGLLVPLARPGALLPTGRAIDAAYFQGVVSEGMVCSAAELGLDDDARGLMELAPDVSCGADLRQALGLDHDLVLTLELTPNRADCLSALGIARELAILEGHGHGPGLPACQELALDGHQVPIPISVEATDGCLAYAGRPLGIGQQNAFTPTWMRERLRRSGMRIIHPVVDITNYVMLETGQPLHAFDADLLQPPISIRWAGPEETLMLLDGRTMNLQREMLVIADGHGPLALAGIMGGVSSAIREGTRRLFLESALFTPQAIRAALRRNAPHTEASHRFERGVPRNHQHMALDRASALLQEWAGAAAGPMSAHGLQQPLPTFSVRAWHVTKRLGQTVECQEIISILQSIGAQSEVIPEEKDALLVTAPAHRWDLTAEVDVVEEVARLKGYQNIPRRMQPPLGGTMASMRQVSQRLMAQQLVHRGFFEVINYSFTSRAMQQIASKGVALPIANPLSEDGAVLRTSLLPGLLGVLRHNLAYRRGMVRIFEMGTVFHDQQAIVEEASHLGLLMAGHALPEQWGSEPRVMDFYDLKGEVEALLDQAGHHGREYAPLRDHPLLHPGQAALLKHRDGRVLGILGVLHPGQATALHVEGTVLLAELFLPAWQPREEPIAQVPPRFPSVRRDISVVVPEAVPAVSLLECCRRHGGALLEDVVLFDVYRGKGVETGWKSMAVGLSFRDRRHTLDDSMVQQALQDVIHGLQVDCKAELRAFHDHHQG
jgi:phenylalanyl-tRNA synthetase beta chain